MAKRSLLRCLGGSALMFAIALSSAPASAQSRRNGAGITVFTNPNFGGQSATFRNDMPDLRGYSLNDKISSIEIPNGEAWEICQDINYGNRCQVLTGSVSDLRGMGWNDRISSLRRVRGGFNNRQSGGGYPNNAPELVFYDQPGFRGKSTVVTTSAANLGSGNRNGSVQIRGGSWALCDRSGYCATVSQSVSDLSRLGLNGRIASIRPLNDRNYGYDQGNRRDRYYGR